MAKRDDAELDGQQELTLSFDRLLELVQAAAKAGTLDAEAVATIAAKATAQATEAIHPTKEIPYHYRSAFNPLGEREHPRPELLGDIYWAGYLLNGDEVTKDEIELLNLMRPGDFEIRARSGAMLPFKVRDLDPGSRDSRRLLAIFPCTTADQRHDLPTMVEMLTQVFGEPVPA